jgi:glycosyltransferase involved in cell wall biosynthesis
VNLCIVQPNYWTPTETFLQAQADRLPATTSVLHGSRPKPVTLSPTDRIYRCSVQATRWMKNKTRAWEQTKLLKRWFRKLHTEVVLAQYGPTGVRVMDACLQERIPFVVHFHGFDASHYQTLSENAIGYRRMFQECAAVVAVSRAMQTKLISLGAPPDKVHYCPYGVDLQRLQRAAPGEAAPVFLAVGRFVEKKSPDRLIRAFAEVHKVHPESRLRMIGEGPLLQSCRQLAANLHIQNAIEFLGVQSQDVVLREMANARCFVQHSVVSLNGDREGTPLAILEASGSGLPVVSTHHAGIPDVVLNGQTGFLVEERDVPAMADRMLKLVEDPQWAARLGDAARARIIANYSIERQLNQLTGILGGCIDNASRRCA